MAPGIEIRQLAADDAPAYRQLRLRMLDLYPDAFTSSVDEDIQHPLKWTESRIAWSAWAPDNFVLGAFGQSGELIGAVGITRESRIKQLHKATLFGMFVAPEHAGTGTGRALLENCLARCRASPGLMQVNLTVTTSNRRACAFYQAAGFLAFGIEERAILVDAVFYDKTHMTLRLKTS